MRLKYIFFILISLLFFSFTFHKYYLSLTEVNYKEKTSSLQIITNVFMDDIELALNKDFNIDLQLTTKNELENNDIYFKKYLNKKLLFKINDTLKKFNYIGKEYDGDLVFFYLEVENIKSINSLEISNKILTSHFSEQKNIIKSNINNSKKSFILNKEETTITINNK